MELNRQNLLYLSRGFNTIFQGAFEAAPSQYGRIAMTVPSTGSEEQYGWLGSTTQFREWVGDRVVQSLKSHDYTIKNKPYENTISMNADTLRDDKAGVYAPLLSQLGQDAKEHPDLMTFGMLAQGTSQVCYDGQYFFDTDHPVVDASGAVQSVSNFGGGAGTAWYLLDDTRAVKPIVWQVRQDYKPQFMIGDDDEAVFMRKELRWGIDARVNAGFGLWQLAYCSKQTLDQAAYVAARAAMRGLKRDGGAPLNIRPSLLLVPPSLEKAALDVVKAEHLANGATNVMAQTAKVEVCSWLG